MIIVYYSFTNQVRDFVSEIDKYEVYHIDDYVKELGEYILITPTHGFGDIPEKVQEFLTRDSNHENMVGVCASGRSIWKLRGTYCKSADVIHDKYGVPILLKFEMKGTSKDRETLFERIEQIEQEKLHRT
jgi:protein involved in ribonucleotide reduction